MNPNSSPENSANHPHLTAAEYAQWQINLAEASRNNIWCHCRACAREWVASSTTETCTCGSPNIQYVHCWMFPDD
ncbi:hypothetical protein IQ266_00880 [filamentous cyanobacterium LEGE 11480]|uniref:Uncharacterized protein n=1 Tax=Romeriopsis navalis LEGE 11480 TaxID=2777977 RepID=A0A928Z1A4_9CYAN|nr:hypothetical protein [Romeriopsis navalis]MBE9028309.1 hypothetical protein [Romeriopsis navalis LEGE 11480]